MKKIVTFAIVLAAFAMVSCCGGNNSKKCSDAKACTEQTCEGEQKACCEGEQKACEQKCEQAEGCEQECEKACDKAATCEKECEQAAEKDCCNK